jgi:hypothetical protein
MAQFYVYIHSDPVTGLVRYVGKGKQMSSEAVENNRNAQLGLKHKPCSDETKSKIAAGNKGKVRTEEQNQINSIVRKGKPWSEARRNAQLRKVG